MVNHRLDVKFKEELSQMDEKKKKVGVRMCCKMSKLEMTRYIQPLRQTFEINTVLLARHIKTQILGEIVRRGSEKISNMLVLLMSILMLSA